MIVKNKLTEVLLKATLKANRRYEKISRGAWLCDYGIEGFMASFLAMEVADAMPQWYETGHVTLEEPIYSFADFTGAIPKSGRKKKVLREGGRVDLALWIEGKGQDQLIGAIEAKRGWSVGEAKKDISRLRELKNYFGKEREGQIQYASFVTFLFSGVDPEGDKMEALQSNIEEWVRNHKKSFGRMRVSFSSRCHTDTDGNEVYRGSAAVIEVL